jgi:glucosyl-dolichyl phosphate glucuronosyltransferase
MPADPRLSVVICTWNRAALLRGCLQSLLAQELPAAAYEVLVVDDGSSDETAAVTADAEAAAAGRGGPTVRHLLQDHQGQPAARNRGIAEARGEAVMFFDDDEEAPPGLLAAILATLDAHPELAGAGGPYRDKGGGLPTCERCSLAAASVPGGPGPRTAERLLGGNMAVRREVFAAVGGFDERLAGRGDDNEWFHRAAAAGHRFRFDPALWVWHRRDQFGLLGLCRHSFRQGLSVPLSLAQQGKRYRPRPGRIPRLLGHAVRHRCAKGLWLAFREVGALVGHLRRRAAGAEPGR